MQSPAETYLLEAADLLAQIEETALALDVGAVDADTVNCLFRAFHTIKGSGAMFGFTEVAQFTHHLESALDLARNGTIPFTPELIEIILRSKDHIRGLLDGTGDVAAGEVIIAELTALGRSLPGQVPLEIADRSPKGAVGPAAKTGTNPTTPIRRYRIRFKPPLTIAHSGLDPHSLVNELRALGECACKLETADVPPIQRLEPELCYLRWTVELATTAELNAVRDVFIFVEDGSEIAIEEVATDSRAPCKVEPGSRPTSSQSASPLGEKMTSRGNGALAGASVVRVPATRLDRLVSLVGELVMNQSRLNQAALRLKDPEMSSPVEAFERLIAELRDNVLGIRMTPIGSTFSRFRRLVHDLSRELNKDVTLITSGEETELDKTVLDQLGEALVHLIRNSLDHGIESTNTRLTNGKPAKGTIRLTATHQGSEVFVTVEDDGKGLDPQFLRSRAIEKGLIPANSNLSDREALELIFLPGFSTASAVTSVSGRGVGMDVVRRQVESMRGSVKLTSEVGRGTRVTLALPMTLAIIDGLLVEVGGDPYIVPMSAVLENVELPERAAGEERNLIPVRGELVPYVRLRRVFDISGHAPRFEKIVVVRHEGGRVGLVVDRVLGSHQTVIQSLNRFCRGVDVLSGTTIMGDGRVALILDIAGVLRRDAETQRKRLSDAA